MFLVGLNLRGITQTLVLAQFRLPGRVSKVPADITRSETQAGSGIEEVCKQGADTVLILPDSQVRAIYRPVAIGIAVLVVSLAQSGRNPAAI